MKLKRFVKAVGLSLVLASAAGQVANAQDFRNKPITIFAGSAGGSVDFLARLLAEGLIASFGQRPIIDNRGGIVDVRAMAVVKSPPDGHTLMVTSAASWLAPFARDDVPFDPIKDFTPIVLLTQQPMLLMVAPSVQAKTVKELIAYVKANPDQVNYAIGSRNASSHIAGELFTHLAGLKVRLIPYKGSGQQITAVLRSEVAYTFLSADDAIPLVRSGKLRAFAVTSPRRSTFAPEVPTVSEAGLPGYEQVTRYGMVGPARMPEAIVNQLNQEMNSHLSKPEVKQRLLNAGVEVVGGTPKAFADVIAQEMKVLGPLMTKEEAAK